MMSRRCIAFGIRFALSKIVAATSLFAEDHDQPFEKINCRLEVCMMNRSAMLILIGIFAGGTAAAQSEKDMAPPQQKTTATSAQAPAPNVSLASGSPIDAALTKSLDSKKAKKGDPIRARITEDAKEESGNTVIPKGAKLEGHVTQSSSREKGDSYSTLGILFDKAVLKDGQEVPLNVQIQAIALSQDATTAPASSGMSGTSPMGGGSPQAAGPGRSASSGGMQSNGTPAAMANTTNPNVAANTDTNNAVAGTGAVGGLNASGQLKPGSRGVFGLQGIGLATASEGTPQAVVVTSTDKNVHLDSGTQLLLVTQSPKS
jgi:hypothetical protein